MTTTYGIGTLVPAGFDETVERTRAALSEQGFGVLTEIDVAATMKAKLDVDLPPHLILGACNPPLAHRALTIEPSLGLLLPCNVVIRAIDDDTTSVEALNPDMLVAVAGRHELRDVADEVRRRLAAALAGIEETEGGR